ncbi:MAG TPA: hypothetical protein VNT52_17475, partial [Acidimicrobiales bacterium]|nr:hypothetical protein [Acidimicrobiales bacterium]
IGLPLNVIAIRKRQHESLPCPLRKLLRGHAKVLAKPGAASDNVVHGQALVCDQLKNRFHVVDTGDKPARCARAHAGRTFPQAAQR